MPHFTLRIDNDLLLAVNGQEKSLEILDLSAAFDTVSHRIISHIWQSCWCYLNGNSHEKNII